MVVTRIGFKTTRYTKQLMSYMILIGLTTEESDSYWMRAGLRKQSDHSSTLSRNVMKGVALTNYQLGTSTIFSFTEALNEVVACGLRTIPRSTRA